MEDSDIVLLISDDGIGIAAEQLATILSGEGASSSGGTNIAVYNTHRRLQILYGSDYGLSYTSNPGQGTEVEIRIPARKHSATLDYYSSIIQKIKKRPLYAISFFEYEYVYKVDGLNYLVTISTGILKIFATFRIVSICLPVAAAI